MNFPENLKYTKDHEWILVEGDQATVGITNPNQLTNAGTRNQDRYGLEGKASYSFAANDVTGKIWVSGLTQKVDGAPQDENQMWSADIGANVKVAGFDLTGYYYGGEGLGTTVQFRDGYSINGKQRDSQGGYVQATYALPTKTKVGISWGKSELDQAGTDNVTTLVKENTMTTVGLYHPLTKHLNLVAEYNNIQSQSHRGQTNESQTYSVGGILFF